jgi:excisionase family DNA binding protein
MNTEEPARWLTTSQAATALGVTPKTIRRRIKAGELEARKVARDGGGIVWEVCIGDGTPSVKDSSTDTERPSKGTLNAQSKGQDERAKDTGTPTEKDMGAERNAHGKDSERMEDLRNEVKFLRGVIEQLQRDGAETRAALRTAQKLNGVASAPMLTTGTIEPTQPAPERTKSAAMNDDSPATAEGAQRPSNRRGDGLKSVRDGLRQMFMRK